MLGIVEVLAGWKLIVPFKMLGPQWLRNNILLSKPSAQIDQLATLRAKRAMLGREPLTGFFARRTFN
jgi:hypothetical protein